MRTGAGGRHAAPASRPAVALIMLLAGSLVTLAGVAGIVIGALGGLGLGGLGLGGLGLGGRGAYAAGPVPHVAEPHGPVARLPDAASEAQVPKPVFLVIPAIGVRTRLVRLGTTGQGAMEVPTTTSVAGWYTASPRPGAIGPAVIAGHVDSYKGPGVFYRLAKLRPGDRAFVLRANGTLAVFKITQVRLYRKAAFPAPAVYGPVPYAALRLITCGGYFDRGTGSYLSNVVVFGSQVSPAF